MRTPTLLLALLALLALPLGALADCVPDPPEIGDIGPDSALVCRTLQRLYPGVALRVDGRTIRSPTEVSVHASVDGRPLRLGYRLSGFSWQLEHSDARLADFAPPADATKTE